MHIILETSQVYWRGQEPLTVDDIKRLTIPEIIRSFEVRSDSIPQCQNHNTLLNALLGDLGALLLVIYP